MQRGIRIALVVVGSLMMGASALLNPWALAQLGLVLDARLVGLIVTFEISLFALGAVLIGARRSVSPARLGLLLAGFGLVAAMGEGALRWQGYRPWQPDPAAPAVEPPGPFYRTDPVLGYANRPGRFTLTLPSGLRFTTTHDRHGRRVTGSETRIGSTPRPSVWIFGCSYTHGWSVDDADAYPSQLQSLNPDLQVVNFGVGGYGTLQSLLQLEASLEAALEAQAAPRVVVLAYASFHDRRNTFLRGRRKALSTGNFIRADAFPYARWVGDSLETGSETLRYRPWPGMGHSSLVNLAESASNRLGELFGKSRRASLALVLRARDRTKRAGSHLVLAGITDDAATARLLGEARQAGVATVDISTDLDAPGARNRPHSGHPSAASHRRYAEVLSAYLLAERADVGLGAR